MKRLLDVVVGGVLAALALPAVGASCLAVRVADGGPVLFRQTRVGRNSRPFDMWKIRTMYVDGDVLLEDWLQSRPDRRREYAQYGRLTEDPRLVPGVGRLLRRSSLDELPQLLHVMRGEMSLVGPRPLPAAALAGLPPAAVMTRASVPPGVTGLWQVSGRSDHDLAALVSIDCEYVSSWSLALDLRILLRTPRALLTGRGAY